MANASDEEILEMLRAGTTVEKVARALHVGRERVARLRDEAGIEPHPFGKPPKELIPGATHDQIAGMTLYGHHRAARVPIPLAWEQITVTYDGDDEVERITIVRKKS